MKVLIIFLLMFFVGFLLMFRYACSPTFLGGKVFLFSFCCGMSFVCVSVAFYNWNFYTEFSLDLVEHVFLNSL